MLVVLLGAVVVVAGAAPRSLAQEETWRSPECEQDGNPLAGTDYCTPDGPVEQPPPIQLDDPCQGSAYCGMTIEELQVQGLVSPEEAADHEAELESVLEEVDPGDVSAAATRYYGWTNFNLYLNQRCSGTVKDNDRCGWVQQKHAKYVDGKHTGTYNIAWAGRSGNNKPADRWVRNVGPIPNDHSGNPGHQWRWGWMNQAFTGYESDTRESFYPGKWRLDPWVATKSGGGATRSAFEIHGGRYTKEFVRTAGCVRMRSGHVPKLKWYWDHRTDNKQDFPGPKMFVNFYS